MPVRVTKSQIYYIFLAIYSSPFFSFTWQWNRLSFHVVYHRMVKILWCHILTCDIKQKLFIKFFLLKFLVSLLSIFLSYLSLLLDYNKTCKIIFKTMFDVRKEHITLHVSIFEFYFIKSLFRSNVVFSQHHGNTKVEPRPLSSSFNFWRLYRAELKNGRG